MHIHANLFDPNLQLSAQFAAERAAAKKDAEEVRENLFKLAATLDAENSLAQDTVAASKERQQRHARQSDPQSARGRRDQEGAAAHEGDAAREGVAAHEDDATGESTGGHFSAWA